MFCCFLPSFHFFFDWKQKSTAFLLLNHLKDFLWPKSNGEKGFGALDTVSYAAISSVEFSSIMLFVSGLSACSFAIPVLALEI